MVELAERLIGKGFDVKIYDPNVSFCHVWWARTALYRRQLPHIGDLLVDDIHAVLNHGEVLIAGSREGEVIDAIGRPDSNKLIVDLVRLPECRGAARQRRTTGVSAGSECPSG